MTDTDPAIERKYHELLMRRPAAERWLMGARMCESARAMVLGSLPKDQPPLERKIALLRRYYTNDFSAAELARIEEALRFRTPTL